MLSELYQNKAKIHVILIPAASNGALQDLPLRDGFFLHILAASCGEMPCLDYT